VQAVKCMLDLMADCNKLNVEDIITRLLEGKILI
jgi:hypothetical protein